MKLSVNSRINVYSDLISTTSPKLNDFLYERDLIDLNVTKSKSQVFEISPNSSETIISTVRNTTNSGSWSITQTSGYGLVKITPNFNAGLRTERIGNSLLTGNIISLLRLNATIVQLSSSFNISTNMSVGDSIYLGEGTSLPSEYWDSYIIVAIKNNKEISILSPSLIDGNFQLLEDSSVFVFSSSGVQIDDYIQLEGGISYPNKGVFKISQVTSRFVIYQSPQFLEEIDVQITNVQFSQYSYNFLYLETNQEVIILVDNQSFKVKPPFNDDSCVGILFSTMSFNTLVITNNNQIVANVKIFVAS